MDNVDKASSSKDSEAPPPPILLPQELIDCIVGHLNPKDAISLRACALVSRAFISSSQSRLFETISLGSPPRTHLGRPGPVTAELLQAAFQSSPHLTEYVRRIEVYDGKWKGTNSWLAEDQTLPRILLLLQKVTSFLLFGASFHSSKWRNISIDTRSAIETIFQKNGLVDVSILNLGLLPITLLEECQTLKHLRLSVLDFIKENPQLSPLSPSNSPPNLESLDIQMCGSAATLFLTSWLLNPVTSLNIACLRRLSVGYMDGVDVNFDGLIGACSDTLEYLLVDRGLYAAPATINLAPLKNLHTIWFHIYSFQTCIDHVQSAINILNRTPSSGKVKEIGLRSYFTEEPLPQAQKLDSLISSSEMPQLHAVKMEIREVTGIGDRRPGGLEMISQFFPQLRAKGILQVRYYSET